MSEDSVKEVYVFTWYERFWHWAQMLLVAVLLWTGFELHGTIKTFGFVKAVRLHETLGLLLIVLTLFTMFWHATTGEVRHLIPTFEGFLDQVCYYICGIFRKDPHPHEASLDSKFNPVQRAAYASLLAFIFPAQLVTGFLLWTVPRWPDLIEALGGIRAVALLHTAASFAMISFLLVHLYMITTGKTLASNLRSMITGKAGH